MANVPNLTEEHVDAIIDGVRTGWLDEITITDETDTDPYVRVILKGRKMNYHKRAYEEICITLGEFRLKPERSYRTFKRVSRQYMALYREAKKVQQVAIQAELSLHPRKKVA